jgi:DNA polymerase I
MKETRNSKKVLLVDAMNLIHRSYYAYPRLATKEGVATGGFFGFVKYLKSLQEKYRPWHMIICSDASRESFRNEFYPEYKGTRKETDQELIVQFGMMEAYLKKCNATFIKKVNYEADDLIGTLAKKAVEKEYEPLIVSGDRDLFQLVSPKVHQIYLSNKGMIYFEPETVMEKYDGLSPEQIVDLKALSGDPSDNIPGIRGIGEKTAIKLLKAYENLEGIYQNTDELKGKQKEKIEKGVEEAYLSRRLATIDCRVEINDEELLIPKENFSLSTKAAFDYLTELNIQKIFTPEDIYYPQGEELLKEESEQISMDL